MPFPQQNKAKQDKHIFRLLFKPETGTLWGFNNFFCEKDKFHDIDFTEIFQKRGAGYKPGDKIVPNTSYETIDDTQPNATAPQLTVPNDAPNNTSEFLHSRLDLLDNHLTINYDLSVPSIRPDDAKETAGQKKKKRKEKFALDNNYKKMTQEELDKEIEFEQNVDLDKTMWLVLRNKKSCNTILRKFEMKDVSHRMEVNDVIKFGRVNFKVSAIKSNKVS